MTENTRYRSDDKPATLDLVQTKGVHLLNGLIYVCLLGKSDHVIIAGNQWEHHWGRKPKKLQESGQRKSQEILWKNWTIKKFIKEIMCSNSIIFS